MKRNHGFTHIKLLNIVAIAAIVVMVAVPAAILTYKAAMSDDVVCKGGYKFTGRDSRAVQVMNTQGHGIPCGNQ